jgi:hypothetical protein
MTVARCLRDLADDGFTIIKGVFAADQADHLLASLEGALRHQPDAVAIRSNAGGVYAARNVLALWPDAATLWRQPPLPEILAAVLGRQAGLVRGLFFDKPPQRTWALPWHQDLRTCPRTTP